jgi:hypothetical protein
MSDSTGASDGSIKYYPYGSTRSGSVPTDKKLTEEGGNILTGFTSILIMG